MRVTARTGIGFGEIVAQAIARRRHPRGPYPSGGIAGAPVPVGPDRPKWLSGGAAAALHFGEGTDEA